MKRYWCSFSPFSRKVFILHTGSSLYKNSWKYLFYRPCQEKKRLRKQSSFFNDVCLRQMMLGNAQWWRLRLMMRGFATFFGKHRIIAKRSEATSFWAKRKTSYRPKAIHHSSLLLLSHPVHCVTTIPFSTASKKVSELQKSIKNSRRLHHAIAFYRFSTFALNKTVNFFF